MMTPSPQVVVLRVVLDLAILLALVMAAISALVAGGSGGETTIYGRLIPKGPGAEALEEAAPKIWANVAVPEGSRHLAWLLAACALLLLLLCLWKLRQVVSEAAKGRPFSLLNAGRLRTIGWVLVLYAVGGPVAKGMWADMIRQSSVPGFEAQGITSLDVTPFFAALALFVLAEVFAYGARLTDLTVPVDDDPGSAGSSAP